MTSEEEKYGYQEDPLPGQVDPAIIVDGGDIALDSRQQINVRYLD